MIRLRKRKRTPLSTQIPYTSEWSLGLIEHLTPFVIPDLISDIRSYISPKRHMFHHQGFYLSTYNPDTDICYVAGQRHQRIYPSLVKYHSLWDRWIFVTTFSYTYYNRSNQNCLVTWSPNDLLTPTSTRYECQWLAGCRFTDEQAMGHPGYRQKDGHARTEAQFQYMHGLEIDSHNGDIWLLDCNHLRRLRNDQVKTVWSDDPSIGCVFEGSYFGGLSMDAGTGHLYSANEAANGVVRFAKRPNNERDDIYDMERFHPFWLARSFSGGCLLTVVLNVSPSQQQYFVSECSHIRDRFYRHLLRYNSGPMNGEMWKCGLWRTEEATQHTTRTTEPRSFQMIVPLYDSRQFGTIDCFSHFDLVDTLYHSLLDEYADSDLTRWRLPNMPQLGLFTCLGIHPKTNDLYVFGESAWIRIPHIS